MLDLGPIIKWVGCHVKCGYKVGFTMGACLAGFVQANTDRKGLSMGLLLADGLDDGSRRHATFLPQYQVSNMATNEALPTSSLTSLPGNTAHPFVAPRGVTESHAAGGTPDIQIWSHLLNTRNQNHGKA